MLPSVIWGVACLDQTKPNSKTSVTIFSGLFGFSMHATLSVMALAVDRFDRGAQPMMFFVRHMHRPDDLPVSLAFASVDEVVVFDSMISMDKIGPMMALRLVDTFLLYRDSWRGRTGDIIERDLQKVQGVGKATAQRVAPVLHEILGRDSK